MKKFTIITIFPNMIDEYASKSILKRGQENGAIQVASVDLRKFSKNKHNTVDDTPYGGGPGMVLKPEPIYEALRSCKGLAAKSSSKKIISKLKKKKKRTIVLSPRGRTFTQAVAKELLAYDELFFICGRYEGIDERVIEHMVDEEISIGDFVLAGGELGALVITEAVARLVPDVLGNPESIVGESHSDDFDAEYPQYTKPEVFKKWKVPEVLMSGHHKNIEEWRKKQSKLKEKRTKK